MGHKVNPTGFRLGPLYTWRSKWFARQAAYPKQLRQDAEIRSFLRKRLREAGLAEVEIERSANALTVTLTVAKPGVVIGRGGAGIDTLRLELAKLVARAGAKQSFKLNIQEVADPNLSAPVVVQGISQEIEKRLPFRRVMKMVIERVMNAGAKGVKVQLSGRLNGAEIARTEHLAQGKIPLQTLRADIDYSRGAAFTTYGAVGIKVWIYRGEVFGGERRPMTVAAPSSSSGRPHRGRTGGRG